MSDSRNVEVTKDLLEAFKNESSEKFLEHCAEGFIFTVGDPVGQDCVPFFGMMVGHDQYLNWLKVCEENPFKLLDQKTDKIYDGGNNVFALGEVTYMYKPTNEEVKAKTATHVRFVNDKAIEVRRWMEGTRFYRKNENSAA